MNKFNNKYCRIFIFFNASIFLIYSYAINICYNVKILRAEKAATQNLILMNEIVNLTIPISEIKWVEKKEFIWHGEMYDVEYYTIENDSMHCIAYKDAKEKNLAESFFSLLNKKYHHDACNQPSPDDGRNKFDFNEINYFAFQPDFIDFEYNIQDKKNGNKFLPVLIHPPRI